MSDIPELDRLIDEAENVKRNNEWDRMDRFFRRSLGYFMLSALSMLPLSLVFGKTGAAMGAVCAVLSAVPLLCVACYTLLHDCFTDPPRRDPTKRYKRM